jgi:hypothetical protein
MDIDPRLRSDTSSGSQYPPLHRASASLVPPTLAPNPSHLSLPHQYQAGHDGPHQSIYSPHTPQGINSGSGNERPRSAQDGSPEDGGTGDPKRPRACEACRGLKVRCELDVNNPNGPCKRCAKANRNCVVTVPSRKRQKKTDSRVAELEKKIDALTATLHATKSGSLSAGHDSENGGDLETPNVPRPSHYEQVTNGTYGAPFGGRHGSDTWTPPDRFPKASESEGRLPPPPMVIAGQKRKHQESRDYSIMSATPAATSTSQSDAAVRPHHIHPFLYGEFPEEDVPQSRKTSATHQYADVVDRGIVTMDKATKMFHRYVDEMSQHMPVVVFPPGTTAADIRKSKPTLFLAVLCAGSGTDHPEIQRVLTKEVMQMYADRVICAGEKTLELVQSLLVSTIWYWPPEHFEELKFYQLIHLAAVMAIDININKRTKSGKSKVGAPGLWRDHPWRRTPFPDSESLDARRAWLGCYFMCGATSMGLRRPNLVRWTNYMAECMEVLESSADAALTDKFLCQLVRSQRIAEDVGMQFCMDDPSAQVNIADSKVQYALRGFERDLEHWSIHVPKEVRAPTLKMAEHVVNLYMHEVAMHVDHNVEEFKPPFTEEGLRGSGLPSRDDTVPLTRAHVDALSTCLTSVDGVFEAFFSVDIEVVRALPILYFVRIAYAVVVLIKMYFAAAKPNSELGKVIKRDEMKVEHYLDGLLEKFRATAADDKSRPAAKFLMVLVMLKTWFHRSKAGGFTSKRLSLKGDGPLPTPSNTEGESSGQTPAPSGPSASQQGMLQNAEPEYNPANTPLQLLSEVATGGTPRPESRNTYPASTATEWSQNPQLLSQSASSLVQHPHPHPQIQQQQQQQQNFGYDPSTTQQAQLLPNYPVMYAGQSNIDPSLGLPTDFDFSLGDGFEQAMGMGDGDFGKYFQDDVRSSSLLCPLSYPLHVYFL